MPALGDLVSHLGRKLTGRSKVPETKSWDNLVVDAKMNTITIHTMVCRTHNQGWYDINLKHSLNINIPLVDVLTCKYFSEVELEIWRAAEQALRASKPRERFGEFTTEELPSIDRILAIMRHPARRTSTDATSASNAMSHHKKTHSSVLAPATTMRDLEAMTYEQSLNLISELLSIHAGQTPPPLIVSAVFFSPIGSPITVNDDLVLHNNLSLHELLRYFNGILDKSDNPEKVLVRAIDFRIGSQTNNFPPITGTLIDATGDEMAAIQVSWDLQQDTSIVEVYWIALRTLLQFGVLSRVVKPILKIRTLYQLAKPVDSVFKDLTLIMKNGKKPKKIQDLRSLSPVKGSTTRANPMIASPYSPIPYGGTLSSGSFVARSAPFVNMPDLDPCVFQKPQSPKVNIRAPEENEDGRKNLHTERKGVVGKRSAPPHRRARSPVENAASTAPTKPKEMVINIVLGGKPAWKEAPAVPMGRSISQNLKREKVNMVLGGESLPKESRSHTAGGISGKAKKLDTLELFLNGADLEEELQPLNPSKEEDATNEDDHEEDTTTEGSVRPFTGAEKLFTPDSKMYATISGLSSVPGAQIFHGAANTSSYGAGESTRGRRVRPARQNYSNAAKTLHTSSVGATHNKKSNTNMGVDSAAQGNDMSLGEMYNSLQLLEATTQTRSEASNTGVPSLAQLFRGNEIGGQQQTRQHGSAAQPFQGLGQQLYAGEQSGAQQFDQQSSTLQLFNSASTNQPLFGGHQTGGHFGAAHADLHAPASQPFQGGQPGGSIGGHLGAQQSGLRDFADQGYQVENPMYSSPSFGTQQPVNQGSTAQTFNGGGQEQGFDFRREIGRQVFTSEFFDGGRGGFEQVQGFEGQQRGNQQVGLPGQQGFNTQHFPQTGLQTQQNELDRARELGRQVFTPAFFEEGRIDLERQRERERQRQQELQHERLWRARAASELEMAKGFDEQDDDIFFPAGRYM